MAKTEQIGSLMRRAIIIAITGLFIASCNPNKRTPAVVALNPCPSFNEDSAYAFIENQLAFGYRIPETEAHQACGDFLVQKLSNYGFSVTEQVDTVTVYGEKIFPLRNILASVNTNAKKRVLLAAHWDSRHIADYDPEQADKPFASANDGASGVACILELARNIGNSNLAVGIDIALFDLEDQGRAATDTSIQTSDHGYCMGSKYWAENLTAPTPEFGIVLDMVGAENAQFTLEGTSWEHGQKYVETIWDMGNQLGFQDYFVYNRTYQVYDDHARINQLTDMPCVAIIHQDASSPILYPNYWHTHADNIDAVDRKTLKAVGQTVMQVLYNL